jgi:two-component system OmpR family response regulator
MSIQQAHIMLVEDDAEIARSTTRFLTGAGYRVTHATDGRSMDRLIMDARIDLVLLDLMLPGEDGLSICRRLRATTDLPVIMLTALGNEIDRVIGLEIGADDYIAKPFSTRELLARVRAVLRRAVPREPGKPVPSGRYSFAGWTVDPISRQLINPEGVRVVLTWAEFDLLVVFCSHSRRVLTRDQLIDLTHGRNGGPFDRSIDTLVSRIRRKIERDPREPALIQTIRLGGYMFTAEVVGS